MKNRLKELRHEKNLTIRDVGDKIGLDPSAISLIENGKRKLSDIDIVKICKAYNVSADYLLGLNDKHQLQITTVTNQAEIITKLQYFLDLIKYLNIEEMDAVFNYISNLKK